MHQYSSERTTAIHLCYLYLKYKTSLLFLHKPFNESCFNNKLCQTCSVHCFSNNLIAYNPNDWTHFQLWRGHCRHLPFQASQLAEESRGKQKRKIKGHRGILKQRWHLGISCAERGRWGSGSSRWRRLCSSRKEWPCVLSLEIVPTIHTWNQRKKCLSCVYKVQHYWCYFANAVCIYFWLSWWTTSAWYLHPFTRPLKRKSVDDNHHSSKWQWRWNLTTDLINPLLKERKKPGPHQTAGKCFNGLMQAFLQTTTSIFFASKQKKFQHLTMILNDE